MVCVIYRVFFFLLLSLIYIVCFGGWIYIIFKSFFFLEYFFVVWWWRRVCGRAWVSRQTELGALNSLFFVCVWAGVQAGWKEQPAERAAETSPRRV